jgi:hypothetical protein
MRPIRLVAYLWALPCSLVGLLAAIPILLLRGRVRVDDGVIEIVARARGRPDPPALTRILRFSAITFGHVIISVSQHEMQSVRAHERAHVAQYERWGVLFLLAYPLAGVWQALRGRRPYEDNPFEVEARNAAESGRAARAGEAPRTG